MVCAPEDALLPKNRIDVTPRASARKNCLVRSRRASGVMTRRMAGAPACAVSGCSEGAFAAGGGAVVGVAAIAAAVKAGAGKSSGCGAEYPAGASVGVGGIPSETGAGLGATASAAAARIMVTCPLPLVNWIKTALIVSSASPINLRPITSVVEDRPSAVSVSSQAAGIWVASTSRSPGFTSTWA